MCHYVGFSQIGSHTYIQTILSQNILCADNFILVTILVFIPTAVFIQ